MGLKEGERCCRDACRDLPWREAGESSILGANTLGSDCLKDIAVSPLEGSRHDKGIISHEYRKRRPAENLTRVGQIRAINSRSPDRRMVSWGDERNPTKSAAACP